MFSSRLMTLLVLALPGLLVPRWANATAIADSTLDFSNLMVVPATGSLTLDGPWLLQAFASANNSLGESDAQFDFTFSPGTVNESANVTWAMASGTATALGDPPDLDVSGAAASMVNISDPGSNAAFASPGTGTLSDCFTVSGTGSVDVTFATTIGGLLHAFTDALGTVAATETTFSLQVDGDQVLFYDQSLSIGPNDSQTQNFSTQLSNTVSLDTGVSHCMVLEADSESHAQTQSIGEPPSSALLLAGLAAWLWGARRGPRSKRARTKAC